MPLFNGNVMLPRRSACLRHKEKMPVQAAGFSMPPATRTAISLVVFLSHPVFPHSTEIIQGLCQRLNHE